MEWHEVLAWVVIGAAFVVAAAWVVKRIFCPESRCESCDKECALKRNKTKIKIK